MLSNLDELSNYLSNWKEPIKPTDLAVILGLSLATVRVYKSRMDLDPITYSGLLPKPLPKSGKKVLYSKASILDWWLSRNNILPQLAKPNRGRPTKAQQILAKSI